jgi:predicted aminopeptidase
MQRRKPIRRWLLVLGLALVAGSFMFCSPGYVVRAGIEEAKILSRRQPIDDVIDSPATADETRAKLALVRNARTFAAEELELDVGDSYTTFSQLDSDTLLMVVTAAPKDRLVPYTWWFPIVGRVPYKGFFDPADAFAEAERLRGEGYDTHVRVSGAFSTLGWFNDPMLSTLLDYDDVSLASTVIHEVTHNTTFIPGRVAFNESFANFVGDVGAIEYFCGVEGEEGERCRRARARWHDDVVFASALERLLSALGHVYEDDDLSYEEKLAARDEVIRRWREGFEREVVPRLQVAFRTFHERPINNATLLGIRLYYDRLDLFDRVHRELGLPLRESVARMREAAESSPDAPFDAVAGLVG